MTTSRTPSPRAVRAPLCGTPASVGTARFDRRRGVTLLELLLALGLAALLLGILFAAVGFQLKMVDTRRTDVEQSQLARSLLRRMADDIKSTVAFDPVDFSAVSQLAAAGSNNPTALAGQDEADGDEMGGMPGDEADGDELPEDGTTETTEAIATSVVPPTVPGLYGNQFQLQIDVTRLPRIDEYQAMQSGGFVYDRPGDVRTVAYYLDDGTVAQRSAASSLAPVAGVLASSTPRGLVRRSLNRAVTAYAAQSGNTGGLEVAAELIAEEVVALEFRYFDGFTWYTAWDSDAMGGLPVAVEIAMALARVDEDLPAEGATARGVSVNSVAEEVTVFRLVVRIPAARPAVDNSGTAATPSGTANPSAPPANGTNTNNSNGSQSGADKSGTGNTGSMKK